MVWWESDTGGEECVMLSACVVVVVDCFAVGVVEDVGADGQSWRNTRGGVNHHRAIRAMHHGHVVAKHLRHHCVREGVGLQSGPRVGEGLGSEGVEGIAYIV